MQLPVMPPVKPMLAKPFKPGADGDVLPPGDGMLFEPKWDGFRCIVFRDGDEIVLGSRNERPLTRYFPELIEPLKAVLPEQAVVDGELVIATAEGLDFDGLQQRIHPAESRINRLAAETPASFVAFDLLAVADRSLMAAPLHERRALLEEALAGAEPPIHLTPMTKDRDLARDWFVRFEGAGLDGVIAKPPDDVYQPDKRVQLKVKHQRTADCVVGGYRVHKDGNGVGSLLLGLWSDPDPETGERRLNHVGVASSFTAKFRTELLDLVKPYENDAVDDHPWEEWIRYFIDADEATIKKAMTQHGGSRWQVGKDMTFVPLRAELVIEVAYENLLNDRLRHGARFLRWRPDRDPSTCNYEQLDMAAPYELHQIFGI